MLGAAGAGAASWCACAAAAQQPRAGGAAQQQGSSASSHVWPGHARRQSGCCHPACSPGAHPPGQLPSHRPHAPASILPCRADVPAGRVLPGRAAAARASGPQQVWDGMPGVCLPLNQPACARRLRQKRPPVAGTPCPACAAVMLGARQPLPRTPAPPGAPPAADGPCPLPPFCRHLLYADTLYTLGGAHNWRTARTHYSGAEQPAAAAWRPCGLARLRPQKRHMALSGSSRAAGATVLGVTLPGMGRPAAPCPRRHMPLRPRPSTPQAHPNQFTRTHTSTYPLSAQA